MTVNMMQPLATATMPQYAMPQAQPQYAMPQAQYAMPQQQYAMPQQQYAMPQQQFMQPQGMMAPAVTAPTMGRQPVYIDSLAQLPPGAIPLSQGMLSQALGQGQAVQPQPPSTIKTVLGSALKFGAIGGAAGAAFGLIPILPLGLFSGGIVGAVGGAALGAVMGLRKAKAQQSEFAAMQQASQAQTTAQAAGVAGAIDAASPTGTAGAEPAAAAGVAPKPAKQPKHPGAKTWTDADGNLRQVGTGKVLKRAS